MIMTEINGAVAEISLNAAPVNALGIGLIENLKNAVAQVETAGCSVLVIKSGLRVYSAGADLKSMADLIRTKAGQRQMLDNVRAMHVFFDMLEAAPFVSIAKIRGTAVGGGYELALACDFRIASDQSMIGLPEVNLGLLPGAGGTQRLPRLVGEAAARRLILSGSVLPGPEALIAGLVDHCIADAELDEFVQAFAAKLSNQPPHAIAAAKRCILAGRKGMEQGAAQELSETLALYGNEITLGLVDRQLEKGRQKKPVPQTG